MLLHLKDYWTHHTPIHIVPDASNHFNFNAPLEFDD
jgi:hypothetical protein